MLPIEPETAGLQPRNSEIDSVGGGRKSSREIKLDIGGTFSTGQSRAKDFQPDFRLPQGSAKTARWTAAKVGLCEIGKIQVVGSTVIAEGIHQHDARKSRMILGGGFDLGLILFVNLRSEKLSRFFQLLNSTVQSGSILRGEGRVARTCRLCFRLWPVGLLRFGGSRELTPQPDRG